MQALQLAPALRFIAQGLSVCFHQVLAATAHSLVRAVRPLRLAQLRSSYRRILNMMSQERDGQRRHYPSPLSKTRTITFLPGAPPILLHVTTTRGAIDCVVALYIDHKALLIYIQRFCINRYSYESPTVYT